MGYEWPRQIRFKCFIGPRSARTDTSGENGGRTVLTTGLNFYIFTFVIDTRIDIKFF